MKTSKQQKIEEARKGIQNFVEVFEMAQRLKAVGISSQTFFPKVVGCNPTMADITDEQMQLIRNAVNVVAPLKVN
jgi:hypothetical protein